MSQNTQIVADYEINNATPEQIAADYGYELSAVKAILTQSSAKFRESLNNRDNSIVKQGSSPESSQDITVEEKDEILDGLKQLALYSDNESVRARLGIFLYNEQKGRNDKKGRSNGRALPGTTINIFNLNDSIRKARELANLKVVGEITDKVIEVESVKKS